MSTEQKESVDILIYNAQIITMSDKSPIEKGALAIQNGQIVDMGPTDQLMSKYTAQNDIDGTNKIVMPGLINTHTHASMTLFRGLADDLPLKSWLENHIWPAEKQYINRETAVLGAKLAMCEMLRAGVTTFNDMYFFADDIAEAAKEAGMRAIVGEGLLDFATPSMATPHEGLLRTEKMIQKWQNDPLITVSVSAHSPYTCSQNLLERDKALSDKYNAPLHIHVAETKHEVDEIRARTGLTPVAYLDSINFLDEKVIAVHCVHLNQEDIKILAAKNVGVAHCPISNSKLASGVAPIPELLTAGVKVSLGTDGAASNNRLDLFEEMTMAARLHKVTQMDPLAVDAYSALKMATIDGARVLGISDKTGSLEIGKRADVIIIDCNTPNMMPMYNAYSHLVYAMNSASVETVIIDGSVVMKEGKLLTLDQAEIFQEVNRFAQQLII